MKKEKRNKRIYVKTNETEDNKYKKGMKKNIFNIHFESFAQFVRHALNFSCNKKDDSF